MHTSLGRNLLKMKTYNEKRKVAYGKRFFIGCEDMILKQIRDICKVIDNKEIIVILKSLLKNHFYE